MAKFLTIKSRKKVCSGKGKSAKCRILRVKRKIRVNPSQRGRAGNLAMIAESTLDYSKFLHDAGDLLTEEDGKKIDKLSKELMRINSELGILSTSERFDAARKNFRPF